MFISRPRAEVIFQNLIDEPELLVKAANYQVIAAVQADALTKQIKLETNLATKDLISKIIELERAKIQLLMIGEFIYKSEGERGDEVKTRLNEYADMRR